MTLVTFLLCPKLSMLTSSPLHDEALLLRPKTLLHSRGHQSLLTTWEPISNCIIYFLGLAAQAPLPANCSLRISIGNRCVVGIVSVVQVIPQSAMQMQIVFLLKPALNLLHTLSRRHEIDLLHSCAKR